MDDRAAGWPWTAGASWIAKAFKGGRCWAVEAFGVGDGR